MAIVNKAKESFLSRKKWNGNEAGSWCSCISSKSSSNTNNSNMRRQEDREESSFSIMSASLPKSFQQRSATSSYSRSSTSTPISIAESDSNDTSDCESISSTKQYYDEKTW